MAVMRVNPTRMELTRLKKSLVTARRGHKLLKDKLDELMKQFLELVRQNKELREEAESLVSASHQSFVIARAVLDKEALEEALMMPGRSVSVGVSRRNVMSVDVPVFEIDASENGDMFPYGMAFTSGELDGAVEKLSSAQGSLLRLAEIEKSCQLLAQEIERTRRRVNALEYVMIPQYSETIRYITMKLEENERGNITRLMKLKDMMIQEALAHNN